MSEAFLALSRWEGPFLLWVQELLRRPWLDPVVSFYTTLGNSGLLWIALCLLLLIRPRTRRAGAAGLAALLLSLLFTNGIIKNLVGRTRPWLVFEKLVPLVNEPDPNSFPSGHTSAAFAAAVAWYRTVPERWMGRLGIGLAAVMGLSRLYVGVHFPSDVVCGALVGLLCGCMAVRLCKAAEERRLN